MVEIRHARLVVAVLVALAIASSYERGIPGVELRSLRKPTAFAYAACAT